MMLDQMEYQPKLNENYMCFLHYISSFESMYFLPPVLLSHFVFTPLIVGGVALIWKPVKRFSQ